MSYEVHDGGHPDPTICLPTGDTTCQIIATMEPLPDAEPRAQAIVRAVNAFEALLAVAESAASALRDETGQTDADLHRALAALDATHPGWRDWPTSSPSAR